MKTAGWTHRLKRKSRDPWLKVMNEDEHGATFVDMDKKFRWVKWSEVSEL